MTMENNQNLDGLDGLPLDMWMGLHQQVQPQSSTVARSAFQGSGYPQVTETHMGRELLMQQNIPPPSLGTQVEHINFQHHQQYQQMSAPPHVQFNHGSQDRSAWSHLMAFEPSVTNSTSLSAPVPPASHLQDPYSTGLMKSGIDFSGASIKGRERLLMPNSSASSGPLFSQSSLSQFPFQGLSQDKVSQHLNQLMNLSKSVPNTSKVSLSKPLSVSTEFSSLESSGDYSPVSPPANPLAYGDSLLDLARQDKSMDPLGREPSTSALPMAKMQLQGLSGRVNSQAESMSNLAGYAPQRSLDAPPQALSFSLPSTQKPFTSPSDMPLDMTTAVAGKSDLNQIGLRKQTNLVSSLSPFDKDKVSLEKFNLNYQTDGQFGDPNSSSSLIGNSGHTVPIPFMQTQLKNSEFNNRSLLPSQTPASISASVLTSVSLPQEKYIKMPKSTPKKSNFYGRDASLFTLPDATTVTTTSISSTGLANAYSITPNVDSSHHSESNNTEEVKSFVEATQLPFESKDSQSLVNVQTENEPKASDITPESIEDIACLPATIMPGLIPPSIPPGTSALDFCSKDISDKISTPESAPEESQKPEVKMNTQMPEPADILEEETNFVQNIEHLPDSDMDLNVIKVQTVPNSKVPKVRKRKGPGVGKRANKQNSKKAKINASIQSVPQSMVVLERANITHNPLDENVLDDSVENDMKATENRDEYAAPGRKGGAKKKRKNVKDDEEEKAPRRSSSRKSKDNAMRLIELQADAGYVSIPGVDEEQPPKRLNRKRTVVNSAVKAYQNESELSDLSDDSNQKKESDDDYVIDEEEAAAVAKDELADEDKLSNKTFISKKKTGSLRISIKLSGNSSAEIVSGIEDSPVRKKRKAVKKKALASTPKGKQNLEDTEHTSQDLPPETGTVEQVSAQPNSGSSNSDVQTSLMEKYFSSASASKQNFGIKSKRAIGKNVGQKFNKNVVGKNKKLNQRKNHVSRGADGSAAISSKLEPGDTKDNLPKFRCGYCPQRYHTKLDLLTHMDEHMSEMESKDSDKDIAEAKNSFQSKEKGTVHNNSANKKQEHTPLEQVSSKDKPDMLAVQKFTCGECEKVFKSKPLLLDHVRHHTADKPFECDICHKCFADRTLLSAHRKTHEQENLLRCQLCSKAFIHKADLNHHMQSHPKRTGVTTMLKSSSSKTPKKVGQYKPAGESSQVTKKASFASALSGDLDDANVNSGVPGVLVLKRKEIPTLSAVKTKPENVAKETAVAHKTSSLKTNLSSVQGTTVNRVVKSVQKASQPKKLVEMENEKAVEKTLIVEKPETENPSGVCTCKECPDCVTRFLQSFV